MNTSYSFASTFLLVLLLQSFALKAPHDLRTRQAPAPRRHTPSPKRGLALTPYKNHPPQQHPTKPVIPELPSIFHKGHDDHDDIDLDTHDHVGNPNHRTLTPQDNDPQIDEPHTLQEKLALQHVKKHKMESLEMEESALEEEELHKAFEKKSMRRARRKKIAARTFGSLAALGIAGTSMWAGIQYGVIDPRNKLQDRIEATENEASPEHYEQQTERLSKTVTDITNSVNNLTVFTMAAQNAASTAEANKIAAVSASTAAQNAANGTPPDTVTAASQASAAQYAANQATANAQVAQKALDDLTSQATSITTQTANAQQSAQQTIDQVTALKTQLEAVKTAAEASKTAAQAAQTALNTQTAAAQAAVNSTAPLARAAATSATLAQKYSTNASDAAAGRAITYPEAL